MVLLILILGGGFAAWSYTQHQYYVGESGGRVAIFRGVNQDVAGISLSRVYRRTDIPIGQVTTDDRQQIMSTITATSLADANKTVNSIRLGAVNCQKAAAAQQKYQAAERKYKRQLAAYQALKHKHGARKPASPASPGSPPPNCPSTTSTSGGASPGSTGAPSPSGGGGSSP